MFCTVKGFEELGLAKIVDLEGLNCIVEYFDSPVNSPPEKKVVAKSHIVRKKLGKNTRIYYLDDSSGYWLVGRVLHDDGEGLEVRFPGQDVFLNYDQLFVRWNIPIEDPVDFLANVITETPQYAEARSQFLDSYITQRGASWGISALMSSVIELEGHQIGVIRRVLNDPSQRYLLADEVGLGKTIEAGVIIRQAVLDDPRGHRILVLVPTGLVHQWRQELIQRFGLYDYIDDSIFIFPHSYTSEVQTELASVNMLVIDEAHHLASGQDDNSQRLYDLVRRAVPEIDRLLLLSATPVLRNETGFLRMLHLLDPVVYNINDEESFRTKIHHRQALAEAVGALDPENVLFLDAVLQSLLEILPGDERLAELTNALQKLLTGFPDEDDLDLQEAIRVLRAHISETYRLHRRILRNRRKQVKGLTPERKGSRLQAVNESQICRLESALEAWRICVTTSSLEGNILHDSQSLKDFYWQAIEALLVNPEQLKLLCLTRLTFIDSNTFEQEKEYLKEISEIIDTEQWWKQRLDNLTNLIEEVAQDGTKVVVFCSSKNAADTVFSHLEAMMSDFASRHEIVELDDIENETSSTLPFMVDPLVKVIVCDQFSEEGINLQGGSKVVIHFDLPIEPNRIEQRIGRVDRYGSGSAIESLVIADESSMFQKTWYTLLNEGLGVFNHSISSLQYLTGDHLQRLKSSIFDQGIEAMIELTDALGGDEGFVTTELMLIDQQDGLDSLSEVTEIETDSIIDADFDWRDIRVSVMKWVVDTLMFECIKETSALTKGAIDPPFRFQYIKPGSYGGATLIPLSGILENFLGAIDYSARTSSSNKPLSYAHSCHRTTAVRRGCRLVRYGDEFIEAVKNFSDVDDRGRSYAMWRQILNGLPDDEPRMYFRFDFLVEAQLDKANEVLIDSELKQHQYANATLTRRGDSLFPPSVVHVWIDDEGDEVDINFVEKFLNLNYSKVGGENHKDRNLKSQRFRSLMTIAPEAFSNWGERCVRMRDLAYTILVNRQELAEKQNKAIKRAQIEDEVRYAQLSTRAQSLEGKEAVAELTQREFEEKLNKALYEGIRKPLIKVDVAGVVFLSDSPLPNLDS